MTKAIIKGDIVATSGEDGYFLRSGSLSYQDAVVVATDPIVLVSRGGDMRWCSTVEVDKLVVVGVAAADQIELCMRRLEG